MAGTTPAPNTEDTVLNPIAHAAAYAAATEIVESLRGADLDAVRAALRTEATAWQAAERDLDTLPRAPRARLGEDVVVEDPHYDTRLALRDRQEAAQIRFEVIVRRTNYLSRTGYTESPAVSTYPTA